MRHQIIIDFYQNHEAKRKPYTVVRNCRRYACIILKPIYTWPSNMQGGCLGWDGFGILLYSAKDSVKNRNYLTIFCFGALHHTFLLAIHGALQLRSVFLLSCFALFFIRVKCPIQGPWMGYFGIFKKGRLQKQSLVFATAHNRKTQHIT